MLENAALKFVFLSPYKGGTKEWSTTVHLSGGDWAEEACITNMITAMGHTAMLAWMLPETTLEYVAAINSGSALPVFEHEYDDVGTYEGTEHVVPLECVALLKWPTDKRSVKNHPIYLFNYLHGVQNHSDSSLTEALNPGMKTRMHDWWEQLVTGIYDGHVTRTRIGPKRVEIDYVPPQAQSLIVEGDLTHRDFSD